MSRVCVEWEMQCQTYENQWQITFQFQDIRSFFTSGAKPKANAAATSAPAKPATPVAQKRKPIVLDSDSDDEERKSTVKSLGSKLGKSAAGKKRRIVSSDEDEPSASPQKKTNGTKSSSTKKVLKPVDIAGALGGSPIKRVEKTKKAKATEKDVFNDSVADDLELMDVDESLLDTHKVSPRNNNVHKEKSKKEASVKKEKESPQKKETQRTRESPRKKETPVKKEFKEPSSEKKKAAKNSSDKNDKVDKAITTPKQSSSAKKEKMPKATPEQENLDNSCKYYIEAIDRSLCLL